uniref:SPRY-associated domain-containing protein n=1 Tax=Electrophorus electricus TaxID=8005 RepID=A0A4W4G5U0_ELEEL
MEVQRKFQLRIQEKEKKVQELKQAVDTLKRFAQAAVNNNRRIFTELIRSIKQRRCEVRDLIRAQEEAELSRAERLLEQLEQEIADLKRRDTELEQFSQTDDDIHFLQSFQSLCVSSGSEDSPSIPVHQHPSFDGVKKSISDLKERLKEFCKEEFNKILQHGKRSYFCQLSLDANTTHRRLSLSERNKVVTRSEKVHLYSDHPERFDYLPQVLSKKSVCGCCYWEVELSNGSYVFISVSYKDISRKGHDHPLWFRLDLEPSVTLLYNQRWVEYPKTVLN